MFGGGPLWSRRRWWGSGGGGGFVVSWFLSFSFSWRVTSGWGWRSWYPYCVTGISVWKFLVLQVRSVCIDLGSCVQAKCVSPPALYTDLIPCTTNLASPRLKYVVGLPLQRELFNASFPSLSFSPEKGRSTACRIQGSSYALLLRKVLYIDCVTFTTK